MNQNQSASAPSDPWVVSIKPKKADVPFGGYKAEFLGVEDCEITIGQAKEPRWRWKFKILTGPHAGVELDDLTNRGISDKNKPGRIVAGFRGGELKHGDNVKGIIDSAVGKPWFVMWGQGQKGGTGIQAVSAPPAM